MNKPPSNAPSPTGVTDPSPCLPLQLYSTINSPSAHPPIAPAAAHTHHAIDVLKSEKKQEFISVHESLKPHALKIDLDALNPAAAHTSQIQHNLICPAPAEMSTFDTFAMDDPVPWIAMVVPIVMKAYFTIVRTYAISPDKSPQHLLLGDCDPCMSILQHNQHPTQPQPVFIDQH